MMRMKVIGIGGAGKNTIKRMKRNHLVWEEVVYRTIDLDEMKTESSTTETDVSVVIAGLGGNCGSALVPEVVQKERQTSSMVITAAYFPFSFEGHKRKNAALLSLKKIKELSDTVFLIRNDDLLRESRQNDHLEKAFERADVKIVQLMDCLLRANDVVSCKSISLEEIRTVLQRKCIFSVTYGAGNLKDVIRDTALELLCSKSATDLNTIDSAILSICCGAGVDVSEADRAKVFIQDLLPDGANVLSSFNRDPDREEIEILGIFSGTEANHVF